jgi:hypothetical protein
MAFTVDIRGNATHLEKTLKLAKGRIGELGDAAKTGVAALAGLGAAGAAAIGAFVVSSSRAAANIESLTMQFETLLGGADAAGKRMEEIVKFAASTPFEIPELAATSKQLQNVGGDMLAIGDGLRMVGDAAAISGVPLEEVAMHIGRVFGAITSGTSAGESLNRLVEIGLLTGDLKREFEGLAAAQKSGKEATLTSEQALSKLQGVFSKTEGAMARLASTTEGKLSNMKDNIGQLQVAFGTGFNDGLRDALDATNNFLPQLQGKFAEAGTIVGTAITQSIEGNSQQLALLGTYMGEVIMAGMSGAILIGFDQIKNIVKNTGNVFRDDFNFIKSKVTGSEFVNTPLSESASMTPRIQSALEQAAQSQTLQQLRKNSAIGQDIIDINEFLKTTKEGTKEGVKEGMKEVWYSLETGAKFQN